jgi:hypothetical protein
MFKDCVGAFLVIVVVLLAVVIGKSVIDTSPEGVVTMETNR